MRDALVIFDLDGVLINSRDLMRRAYSVACDRCGVLQPPPFEDYLQHVGAPLPDILKRLGLPPAMAAFYEEEAQHSEHMAHVEENARRVAIQLQRRGYALALFTGKSARRTRSLLQRTGMDGTFSMVLCGDQVTHGKPHPEGVLRIAEEFVVPLDRIVYVGDSEYDVQCACAAGVQSFAVTWGFLPVLQLKQLRPTRIITSPVELLTAVEEHLPLFTLHSQEPLLQSDLLSEQ
jgi:AHBA synthesis associated protein